MRRGTIYRAPTEAAQMEAQRISLGFLFLGRAFALGRWPGLERNELLLPWLRVVARVKENKMDAPAELALRLSEGLQRERLVPRFVDSYVVEHGRQALQVHAALYKDLLELLQREALLALTARVLEIAFNERSPAGGKAKPYVMPRKDAAAFRRKFLAALTRQQKWSAGDALEFQADLQMYKDLLARNSPARRTRKPYEAANHPFVDRCAFLLDSSFLENARVAASRTLNELDKLAMGTAAAVMGTQNQSEFRTSNESARWRSRY
jgi:hypothetical protein